MEQGEWVEARNLFSAALHSSEKGERRSQVAQYLTAVRLLEAQVCRVSYLIMSLH